MRRRLLVVSMTLVGVVLLALMVPLLNAHAEDRTQDLFVGRLGDVTRFAVLAEDALEGGGFDGLTIDLQRYVEVYGGQVVVTNANREVVASAGAGAAGARARPGASRAGPVVRPAYPRTRRSPRWWTARCPAAGRSRRAPPGRGWRSRS